MADPGWSFAVRAGLGKPDEAFNANVRRLRAELGGGHLAPDR
jgi:hypothetical protein